MTTPSQVRSGLQIVTSAAVADTEAVAKAASGPSEIRSALFAATPLIVSNYIDGSAALALDWYEELRDEAAPSKVFAPSPFVVVDEDAIAQSVAVATRPLYDLEQDLKQMTDEMLRRATDDSLAILGANVQYEVAGGFWDTITGNTNQDPSAVGWQRFARGRACKFCLMLADRGAVYTESTVDFAAHTNCHCVVGPSFDPGAPLADVMQHLGSASTRTPAQRKALREYLNQNFPDAPG